MKMGELIDKSWKVVVAIILEVVVFGLAYWLLGVRFFPDNEAMRNAIVVLFIFAVGITVILYGNVTRNRYLNLLGFSIFLFAIFVVIDRYEGFAVKISAFATLVVAFAAFAAIDENRRMRLEKREQEQEDRKERMLNEIHVWATKVLKNMLMASRFAGNVSDYGTMLVDCRNELILSLAESIRVQVICNSLSSKTQISDSDEDRIKKSMKLVDESLNDFVEKLLELDLENLTDKAIEPLIDVGGSLTSKVKNLLAIVSEIDLA